MGILCNSKLSKSNINQSESQALKSLSENIDITILPADKGKAVVVMDKEACQSQCEKLLEDKDTYKEIETKNPTKLVKGIIQRKLKAIKKAGHIDPNIYNKIYPTSYTTPHFYAAPMIHKDPLKMRPIVSGINSITYHLARHLADLLKPLVGKESTHIQNSKDLIDKLY